MFSRFPLFQSHLDLSHYYWQDLLKPGDLVIDATCGNGHDTLKLAKLAITDTSGMLFAYDLQENAIQSTKKLLETELSKNQIERVHFVNANHSVFLDEIARESVKLVVYNLGYLPGGDKQKTTMVETTLSSVKEALKLISPGGAISITCYPGHLQGGLEERALLNLVELLSAKEWSCCYHQWLNRRCAPSLLFIQKSTSICKPTIF